MNGRISIAAAWVRGQAHYWGARLNAIQAVLVAAIVANAVDLKVAIAAVVPEQYRPIAGLIAGVVSFLIVQAASKSDAKKVAANGK